MNRFYILLTLEEQKKALAFQHPQRVIHLENLIDRDISYLNSIGKRNQIVLIIYGIGRRPGEKDQKKRLQRFIERANYLFYIRRINAERIIAIDIDSEATTWARNEFGVRIVEEDWNSYECLIGIDQHLEALKLRNPAIIVYFDTYGKKEDIGLYRQFVDRYNPVFMYPLFSTRGLGNVKDIRSIIGDNLPNFLFKDLGVFGNGKQSNSNGIFCYSGIVMPCLANRRYVEDCTPSRIPSYIVSKTGMVTSVGIAV